MQQLNFPLTLFFITLIVIALLALFGLKEKSLDAAEPRFRLAALHFTLISLRASE